MSRLIFYLSFCLVLCSCGTLKIPASKKTFTELAIDWNYAEKVNPLYKPRIDSAFHNVINKFNSEGHSIKVHERTTGDQDYLMFTFNKGRFVSKGGVTTGYIVSAVGLIATPVIVLTASGGAAVALFYYFPQDNFNISVSLSPSLSGDNTRAKNSVVQANSLFSNKPKRMNKITGKLEKEVYKLLLKLDKQMR